MKVVSAGERFPKCAWFRCFRMAQRDMDKEDALMQVNKSCISLHNSYQCSVGKGAKHTHIRCFFVGDNIYKRDANIVHCSTEDMLADFSYKQMQGSLFSDRKIHFKESMRFFF